MRHSDLKDLENAADSLTPTGFGFLRMNRYARRVRPLNSESGSESDGTPDCLSGIFFGFLGMSVPEPSGRSESFKMFHFSV